MFISDPRAGPQLRGAFLPRICVLVLRPEAFFPRRAEEAKMNMLGRLFHLLRVWTGLADASESHLTPSHGWLLPAVADARRQRKDSAADPAARLIERNVQA